MRPEQLYPDLTVVPGRLGEIARRRWHEGNFEIEELVLGPTPPSLARALAQDGVSLIAEFKRRSPSQGPIADLDPVSTCRTYKQAGARACSILTEPNFFAGSDADLRLVRSELHLPLLRKDFVVHPNMLLQSRALGASAVLLIVAILGSLTESYLELAREAGVAALVEVHNQSELELAISAGAEIIGVNNRDLLDLSVDLTTAPKLGNLARERGFSGLLVAESGYQDAGSIAALVGIFDGVLVGTALMKNPELAREIASLDH
jgi:indole-3-glycerol phosphate synthase